MMWRNCNAGFSYTGYTYMLPADASPMRWFKMVGENVDLSVLVDVSEEIITSWTHRYTRSRFIINNTTFYYNHKRTLAPLVASLFFIRQGLHACRFSTQALRWNIVLLVLNDKRWNNCFVLRLHSPRRLLVMTCLVQYWSENEGAWSQYLGRR